MNNKFYEHRQLIKSFYATYSVGFFTIFLISSMMIYSPVILEILQITKQELAFAVTIFGLFIIISNLLASRFLINKIGTTNCLKISRLIICFIPLSVFYFENYFFLLISYSFLGIGMGIQAPCVLTQVTIIEKKTNKILTPIFKTSWAFGSMTAAILSSITLGLNINPIFYFFILGSIVIIGLIILHIWGLDKKFDIVNNSP